MPQYDIVVIGAGPAGLLAAGKAASQGAKVLLLEKMEKPARKLRITGKGRCNITNTKPLDEFLEEINPEPRFLRDAFNSFFSDDIIKLLNDNGVATVLERGQRVFPASGKAWDVAEGLVRWAKKQGVEIFCNCKVQNITVENDRIVSLNYIDIKSTKMSNILCKAIIIATGGKSYPATGSTGDGYKLATDCGHKITPLFPTLVGFETIPAFVDGKGLTIKNVNLSFFADGKKIDDEFGDLELMEYGVSGPIVLRLSRKIIEAINQGKKVNLVLDLKPALDNQKLEARLLREIDENPRSAIADLTRKLLPKVLADAMIDQIGLAAQKNLSRLTADERKAIRLWLKELRFDITTHRSWDEAIITAGGVSLKEVNPRTMESKLVQGLFFAGEVLDLDGATGGYNLQIAYSTGWLAGSEAGKQVLANKKV